MALCELSIAAVAQMTPYARVTHGCCLSSHASVTPNLTLMALQRNVGINSANTEAHFPMSWTFNYQQHPRPGPTIAWVWFNYEDLYCWVIIMMDFIYGWVCLFVQSARRHRLPAEGHSLVTTATLSDKWCLIEALSPYKGTQSHSVFPFPMFLIDTTEANVVEGRSHLTLMSRNNWKL